MLTKAAIFYSWPKKKYIYEEREKFSSNRDLILNSLKI